MSNRELEVQFVMSVEKAITSIDTLISKVDDLQKAIKDVDLSFNSSSLKQTAKNVALMSESIGKLSKGNANIARNTGITAAISGFRALKNVLLGSYQAFAKIAQYSIDYTETINKFQVSMGENLVNTATRFNNKMAEAYGYSKNLLMDYQSTFKNIMFSLGSIEEEVAYKTSETLMQMVADYSSLFNVGTEQAMKKFQSALTGSVMPIRGDSGYDVTVKTIYDRYQKMGGTKKQTDLSQTEKRLLRIIVLMDQIKNSGAFGDLARTIEQPANQIRVFKEQIKELGNALGNLFVGTIGRILPYINGFVMALRAIVATLGQLFGLKGASGSSDPLQDMGTSADNIGSGLGAAATNAKALKKEILGFDKLNNITPNSNSSSSGGGGGGVGSIDPLILKGLKEYGSILDDVRMKATKIRDAIMKWLGFTKLINPLTGEISWQYDKAVGKLGMIKNIAMAIAGLFLAKKVLTLVGGLKNLFTLLKGGTPTTTAFGSALQLIGSMFKGVNGYLVSLAAVFKATGFSGLMTKLAVDVGTLGTKLKLLVAKFGPIVLGVASVAMGFKTLTSQIENMTLTMTSGLVGMTGFAAGGALIGSVFGPLGIAIGAAAGEILGAITMVSTYNKVIQKIVEDNLFGNLIISTDDWTTALNNNGTVLNGYSENLEAFLTKMSDIKASFNGASQQLELFAAKFSYGIATITETNFEDVVTSINALGDNAIQAIQEDTDRAILLLSQTFEESGGVIDEGEQEILRNIQKGSENSVSEVQNAQKNMITTFENAMKTRGYLTEEERKYIAEQIDKIKALTQEHLKESESDLDYYYRQTQDLSKSNNKESLKLAKESYANFEKAANEYYSDKMQDIKTWYNEEYSILKTELDKQEDKNSEYSKEIQRQIDELNTSRTNKEKTVSDEINAMREVVYNELLTKYQSLEGKTDETSAAMRSTIEAMFKNANVDFNTIYTQFKQGGQNAVNEFTSSKINISSMFSNIAEQGHAIGSSLRQSIVAGMNQSPIKAKGSLASDGQSIAFGTFATGGFPSVGQMFFARENGPELVGTIGNRTAVVNNNQIVQSVSQGVAQAVSGVIGGGSYGNITVPVYIGTNKIQEELYSLNKRENNIRGR